METASTYRNREEAEKQFKPFRYLRLLARLRREEVPEEHFGLREERRREGDRRPEGDGREERQETGRGEARDREERRGRRPGPVEAGGGGTGHRNRGGETERHGDRERRQGKTGDWRGTEGGEAGPGECLAWRPGGGERQEIDRDWERQEEEG